MPDESPSSPKIVRDARIDVLGFAGELAKSEYLKGLKEGVKGAMEGKSASRAQGDFFDALLTTPPDSTTSPDKFLRLYEAKKISRKELVSALRVSREAAREFLSEKELDKISTTEPGTPRLNVTRKKGVNIKLVDAVRHLAAELIVEAKPEA